MTMPEQEQKYWFRAKRYGWGLGYRLPGRAGVFVAWFALFLPAIRYFIPRRPAAFLVFTVVMSLLLIAICYKTGEPPRWRWGDEDQ